MYQYKKKNVNEINETSAIEEFRCKSL